MNAIDQISTRLTQRFDAYAQLLDQLNPDLLQKTIPVPKHKSLAEHLWCVVGARESYARALAAGSWQGFACSMDSFTLADFKTKLVSSAKAVNDSLDDVSDWNSERVELLLMLAEHEVMHEGQIIRHMYALEQDLPDCWTWG